MPGKIFSVPASVILLHHFLQRERRDDVNGLPGIVPFPMPGRALNDRIVISHARLLRRLRNAINIRDESDHRLAGAPGGHPRRGNSRDAALDRKPFFSRIPVT